MSGNDTTDVATSGCEMCGVAIEQPPSRGSRRKYCSDCATERNKDRYVKVPVPNCLDCGVPVERANGSKLGKYPDRCEECRKEHVRTYNRRYQRENRKAQREMIRKYKAIKKALEV